jgi:RHO1 GDP-GTP exchange protein 1/2
MSALQGFNKLIILHNGVVMAYSLDLIARVGQGQSSHQFLDASLERLAKPERGGTILFFRVGTVAGKTLG